MTASHREVNDGSRRPTPMAETADEAYAVVTELVVLKAAPDIVQEHVDEILERWLD